MSLNVTYICENSHRDRDIIEPILKAVFAFCGKPKAKIRPVQRPIQGIAQAMNQNLLDDLIDQFGAIADLILLIVDRDGEAGRRDALDNLQKALQPKLDPDKRFFGVEAHQEIEVWVLAGHTLPNDWDWKQIRAERDPKEKYFNKFVESSGKSIQDLSIESAKQYKRIRQLCPEDIASLDERIREYLNQ